MHVEKIAGSVSAVGIVLILLIVTWLGLWGPVDLSHLKEWQTLTTGILALVAAGIAYLGATAKVRYDREALAAENLRRKLALYLKTDLALRFLSRKASKMLVELVQPPSNEDKLVTREAFAITEPPELEEAWTYLDLFPTKTIAEIRNIRSRLRNLALMESGEYKVVWRVDADRPFEIVLLRDELRELSQSAALVVKTLEPLIKEMAPEMDTEEREDTLFGDEGDESDEE
jgi:hypothetical protein